jgi:L-seryl-tRNA(Ser) seleniumtransferase
LLLVESCVRPNEVRVEGSKTARLRDLPSVDSILNAAAATALLERFGRAATKDAARAVLAEARTALQVGAFPVPTAEHLALKALTWLEEEERSNLRPVFNLTGTVLHTNLGRAVLAEAAIKAAITAMRDPVALEFDLSIGKRGERDDHVRALLCALTGAEDARDVRHAVYVFILRERLADPIEQGHRGHHLGVRAGPAS